MRWPAVLLSRFTLLLLSVVLVAGCADDKDSDTNNNQNTTADATDTTSQSDATVGELSNVSLEGLELPDPASEGPLCVKLSATKQMTIDSVAIESASGEETFYTFSDVMVGTSASQNCTTACFCQGPNPPELNVRLKSGENEALIQSGKSAPAGCCETM